MTTPPQDVVNDLDTGIAALTKGTNLFASTDRGVGPNIPINAVFVFSQGGIPPTRAMGQVTELRTAIVIVRTRWGSFGGGDAVVRSIQNRLQAGAFSPYLDIVGLEAEPAAIGEDDDGRHLWTQSFMLTYSETKV